MSTADVGAPRRRSPPSLRRRLDITVLRWQARLDSGWVDRVLPWTVAAVLAVAYFAAALARSHTFVANSDLSPALQAAWLIRHGHSPDLTITGHNFFADQAPLAFYPVAQLTRVVPARTLLLGVQAIALGCGVIPIWRIARRLADLRVAASAALVVAYALSPAVNDLNLSGFHQEAIALPALMGAAYNGLSERWRRMAVLSAIAVLCRADLALVIAGLGVLLMVEGKRRAGAWTVGLGLGWLTLALVVIEPHYGTASLITPGAFAAYGHTPWQVVQHVLAHPVSVLGDLFARQHLDLVVLLFAPLLFLPLLAPRYLLPTVPLELLYLLSAVPVSGIDGARYTVAIIAFSFVAAAFALSRLGRRNVERVTVDGRLVGALLLASVAFFARDATDSPYSRPWEWGRGPSGVRDALEDMGGQWQVRASPSLLTPLAERAVLTVARPGDHPKVPAAADDVDALALAAADYPGWTLVEQTDYVAVMRADGWTLRFRANGVLILVGPGV